MPLLDDLISSGRVADLVLLLMGLEASLLTLRWRRGSGPPPSCWLSQLAAGAALVLALRLALTHASVAFIGLSLLVAGAAHLAGFRARWKH